MVWNPSTEANDRPDPPVGPAGRMVWNPSIGANDRPDPPVGIVFDLDDTLIDWWGSLRTCLDRIAEPQVVDALLTYCRQECWYARPGSDDIWHRNTWAVHHHRHDVWPAALGFLAPAKLDALLARFEDELWVDFFPETIPTLDRLAADYRLGVLSNNQLLPAEFDRLELRRWFDVAIAAPFERPKPHGDGFAEVASAMGLEVGRCAYVGDSVRTDVLGALEAGMVPIWLNRWHDAWPDRPAEVIEVATLAELGDALF